MCHVLKMDYKDNKDVDNMKKFWCYILYCRLENILNEAILHKF